MSGSFDLYGWSFCCVISQNARLREFTGTQQQHESPGSHPGLDAGTGHRLSSFMIDLLHAMSNPIHHA
jgi:hypothetical protein